MGNCAMNKEERTIVSDDHKYWDAFGKLLGWELTGFTRQITASYRTPNDGFIQIKRSHMEQIEKAIKNSRWQIPSCD